MAHVTLLDLFLASKILKSRLTRAQSIDTTILDPDELLDANPEQHYGRFVGSLQRRQNNDPYFLLLARHNEVSGSFKNIIVFYLGHKLTSLQDSEKQLLNRLLPAFKSKPNSFKVSIKAINTSYPRTHQLSVLIEVVEGQIGSDLVASPIKCQILNYELNHFQVSSSNVAANLSPCLTGSLLDEDNHEMNKLWDVILSMKFKAAVFEDGPPSVIPSDFDLLVTRFKRHYIYVIHYRRIKTIMLLLPHAYQLNNSRDAVKVSSVLRKALHPYKVAFLNFTRYRPHREDNCANPSLLRACLLLLGSPYNPYLFIHETTVTSVVSDSDIDDLMRNMDTLQSADDSSPIADHELVMSPKIPIIDLVEDSNDETIISDLEIDVSNGSVHSIEIKSIVSSQRTMISSNNESFGALDNTSVSDQSTITIVSSVSSDRTIVYTPPDPDSQKTQIMSDIDIYIALFKRPFHEAYANFMQVSDIPKVPAMMPIDNLNAEILNDADYFVKAIHEIIAIWPGNYVDASLRMDYYPFNVKIDPWVVPENGQFHIFPSQRSQEGPFLVIINFRDEEWGIMCPHNKKSSHYQDVISYATSCNHSLKKYKFHMIEITSYFHKEYAFIHLLMGLYNLGQLFRYVRRLPLKVVYTESAFRRCCFFICREVQIANYQFNRINGYLTEDGHLKLGAFAGISSPLKYERSVVPSDLCPFCKKRGFLNLGRHISMQHGGQASYASNIYQAIRM